MRLVLRNDLSHKFSERRSMRALGSLFFWGELALAIFLLRYLLLPHYLEVIFFNQCLIKL